LVARVGGMDLPHNCSHRL